jgi:hypothetical protein
MSEKIEKKTTLPFEEKVMDYLLLNLTKKV